MIGEKLHLVRHWHIIYHHRVNLKRFLRLVLGPDVSVVDDVLCSLPLFRFFGRGESTSMFVILVASSPMLPSSLMSSLLSTLVDALSSSELSLNLICLVVRLNSNESSSPISRCSRLRTVRTSAAVTAAPSNFAVDLWGIEAPLLGASVVAVAAHIMLLLLGDCLCAR